MSKEIYISSTPHETRLAIVENDELAEIYYERENEYTLAGSIYNGKVTRVLPGMQSSFVDIGLERDAFLYITDFMEEAADTAEFDTSGDGARPARPEGGRGGRRERSEGGRDGYRRNDGRGERPERHTSERDRDERDPDERDRNGNSRVISTALEPNALGSGEQDSSEGSGRNDRGGRGSERGRRGRSGSGSQDRGSGGAGNSRYEQAGGLRHGGTMDTSRFGPGQPGSEDAMLPAEDGESASTDLSTFEVGEGAPGADGSRRWRGRRGRRRGRSVREGMSETENRSAEMDQSVGNLQETPSPEMDGETSLESFTQSTAFNQTQPESSPGYEANDRTNRQRGRTGRGDRGRERDGRGDRDQSAPRMPRGFAPRRSLYGVDGDPEQEHSAESEVLGSLTAAAADPEPLVLPGESLSKYRKGGQEAGSAGSEPRQPVASTAVPDSGFQIDPGWDGGSVLPGESLSRHRGGAAQANASHSRSEGRADLRRPANRQNDRYENRRHNEQRGQESRPADANAMLVPSTVPAADLQSGGPVSGYAHATEHAEEIEAHRPEFATAELPLATADAAQMEDKGLAHQVGNTQHGSLEMIDASQHVEQGAHEEYEPEGKSVSYRVDPSAPSEYRYQGGGAQVLEEPVPETGEAGVAPEAQHKADAFATTSSKEADYKPHVSTLPAGLTPSIVFDPSTSPMSSEQVLDGHEVTMIDAAGAMHSDVATAHGTELDEQTPPQSFAPGAGDLEEDFIEEDELEIVSLHAESDEEFDDLEEEHLDGTADLGTMIRDMTVDHITRTDGAMGDDEFEGDTLETEPEIADEMQEVPTGEASMEERGYGEERASRDLGSRSLENSGYVNSERRGRTDGRRNSRERSGNRLSRPERSEQERSGSEGENERWTERSGYTERARSTGGSGDRERGRSSGRNGRHSAQMTNLPAISDLLKPGQEILVQIAKEPIAKKGARITSHIALPGRFLVFMPTVSHTGVSRKIEADSERRRLKEILLSEKGEASGGFIVRTAAAGASEEELRSDLRFLLNLWSDIKQRSESSKSPALIYHDLNLIERILRDQVTDTFSAIWVDTESEYERVLRFLQRFQPGLIRRVKLYTKETPLFEQFGITEEINKALRSKVWLKSGGSIVINQTEALVAIDINTGKYVGKTARLEDTIVKTNLDAIPEIVRQIRLRDLGGIIIIDFIDMDERKNRNRVMQALEDELKNDRAPSKVLPFNDFGLVAITRKRVKQSLERTLSTTCSTCTGTGMVKSPVTVCNDIYVEMRKMHKHLDRGDVMLRVHPDVVKQLKSTGSRWLQEMEEMCGKTILIKSDPSLHPEQFDIH